MIMFYLLIIEVKQLEFKFNINDRPDTINLLVAALQWLAVGIPSLIIIAEVMGTVPGQENTILYLQKLLGIAAITILIQVTVGHRLPLFIGPSNIILVAILSSQHARPEVINTAMVVCGLLLAISSLLGLFNYIQHWFTSRVVAVILLLVAFAIAPSMRDLIIDSSGGNPLLYNLLFALVLLMLMMTAHHYLRGIWQSALIFITMIVGSAAYYLLFPGAAIQHIPDGPFWGTFWPDISLVPVWEPGVLIAFALAMLALSINDLGSIQSLAEVVQPDELPKRARRGLIVTGIGNSLSGFLGVIGPVNFSFSAGIVMATRNASRYTLIPVGIVMLLLAFMPAWLGYFMAVPPVVIGTVLLYVMSIQVATGLLVAFTTMKDDAFTSAMLIGLPVLLGVIIAFLPSESVSTLPAMLRTILGNGFIVGIVCSLIMEHLIFRLD